MSARISNHEWIGREVYSVAVGRRAAFRGVVISAWLANGRFFRGPYFHVRDTNGSLWHRGPSELELIEIEEMSA